MKILNSHFFDYCNDFQASQKDSRFCAIAGKIRPKASKAPTLMTYITITKAKIDGLSTIVRVCYYIIPLTSNSVNIFERKFVQYFQKFCCQNF